MFSLPWQIDFSRIKKHASPQKAYQRETGIVESHLKPFFNGQLAAIRRVDVQRYVTERGGKASAHSVQKKLNVLKHLFRLAVEWELIPTNPATCVKSPRVPAGRVRYLQPEELKSLFGGTPEWLRPIAGLAVATGMRRSEILGLRFLDVDFQNKRIVLPQTKNGEGRIVFLNELASTVLRSLPVASDAKPTDKLFASLEFSGASQRCLCTGLPKGGN